MKIIAAILILLSVSAATASGQSNRMKVIALILSAPGHARLQSGPDLSAHTRPAEMNMGRRSAFMQASVPKYQLPRCAVICRLEEYVQLHSPIKLNIGLGGE